MTYIKSLLKQHQAAKLGRKFTWTAVTKGISEDFNGKFAPNETQCETKFRAIETEFKVAPPRHAALISLAFLEAGC